MGIVHMPLKKNVFFFKDIHLVENLSCLGLRSIYKCLSVSAKENLGASWKNGKFSLIFVKRRSFSALFSFF